MSNDIKGWLITGIVVDFAVIVANLAEQCVMRRNWGILDRVDHFLFSLSLSDLVTGFCTISVDGWFLYHFAKQGADPTPDPFLTKVFDAAFLFSVFASIFHVTAIAIERLMCVRFPKRSHYFTSTRSKAIMLSIIWALSLLLSVAFALMQAFALDHIFGKYARCSIFLAAILVVTGTYIALVFYLRDIRKQISNGEKLSLAEEDQLQKVRRTTIVCVLIGFSFVACVLPITLGYLSDKLYHPVVNILITFNSLVNPTIYLGRLLTDQSLRGTRNRSGTTMQLLGGPPEWSQYDLDNSVTDVQHL